MLVLGCIPPYCLEPVGFPMENKLQENTHNQYGFWPVRVNFMAFSTNFINTLLHNVLMVSIFRMSGGT